MDGRAAGFEELNVKTGCPLQPAMSPHWFATTARQISLFHPHAVLILLSGIAPAFPKDSELWRRTGVLCCGRVWPNGFELRHRVRN